MSCIEDPIWLHVWEIYKGMISMEFRIVVRREGGGQEERMRLGEAHSRLQWD